MDLNKITKEELIIKLKDSQLKEKFFENVSNIAYFTTDSDRVVTSWNQTCETFYGYKKDKALGKKIETLILPDFQRDSFIKEFKDKNSIFGEELEYQKADGITVRAFVNSLFLDTADGTNQYHHISINPLTIKQSD
jgi:PAS domain S-box-containing protein